MGPRSLADHILRTFTGPMWHGPALSQALVGVREAQAAAHPIAGAHSIWELVLHMTTWAEIAAARIDGHELDHPAAERDWPAPPAATPDAWSAALDRLEESYRELAARVEALAFDRLKETVPTLDHTVLDMLHGVIEHGVYHGAQVVLLVRASGGEALSR